MGCCTSVRKQDGDDDDDHRDAPVTNVNPPGHPPLQTSTEETAPSAMGCCTSAPKQDGDGDDDDHHLTNVNPPHHPQSLASPGQTSETRGEGFRQYTLAELMAATHEFADHNIISKAGDEDLPNFVFRGSLHGGQQIAVKRFGKGAWPDAEEFKEVATAVGRLRHRRLVNLIGYCCDEDERLLVAEFMPNDTLATHLFDLKTMEWSRRLRVACYIAEALEYCIKEEQALNYDLNPQKVLFDEAGNPCLSCFGLVKSLRDNIAYTPPGCLYGMPSTKSMILSFGFLLRDLLSGKQFSGEITIDAILGTRILGLNPIDLDSRVWGKCPAEGASALVELANKCLQYKPTDRPTIEDVTATLAQFQSNAEGPSNPMPKTGAR